MELAGHTVTEFVGGARGGVPTPLFWGGREGGGEGGREKGREGGREGGREAREGVGEAREGVGEAREGGEGGMEGGRELNPTRFQAHLNIPYMGNIWLVP